MRYLIDTNVLIWFFEYNTMLPQRLKNLIKNNNNEIYISIISLWEIVMKLCKVKLGFQYDLDKILYVIKSNNFITISHKEMILI